jgi:hypothetical protein
MANHCHYKICFGCNTDYCALGCGYTCDCGKESVDPAEVRERQKNLALAESRLADSLPEGWF